MTIGGYWRLLGQVKLYSVILRKIKKGRYYKGIRGGELEKVGFFSELCECNC